MEEYTLFLTIVTVLHNISCAQQSRLLFSLGLIVIWLERPWSTWWAARATRNTVPLVLFLFGSTFRLLCKMKRKQIFVSSSSCIIVTVSMHFYKWASPEELLIYSHSCEMTEFPSLPCATRPLNHLLQTDSAAPLNNSPVAGILQFWYILNWH